MTTIIERLEAVRRHYILSGRGLADRLGQRPSTVTNYLNGTQAPKLEFIENILDLFPEVSAEWLIRGQGAMLIVDQPDVAELKKQYETELLVKEGIIKELRSIIHFNSIKVRLEHFATGIRIAPNEISIP